MKTYFYFGRLPRISVRKILFLFLVHGIDVDCLLPHPHPATLPCLQFKVGVKDLGSSRKECLILQQQMGHEWI